MSDNHLLTLATRLPPVQGEHQPGALISTITPPATDCRQSLKETCVQNDLSEAVLRDDQQTATGMPNGGYARPPYWKRCHVQ